MKNRDIALLQRTITSFGTSAICVIGLIALTACDGPREKAGREADRAAAAVAGVSQPEEGPNEKLGEAQDRVERADAQATRAAAKALDKQAKQIRAQADLEAERLEKQAEKMRADMVRPPAEN